MRNRWTIALVLISAVTRIKGQTVTISQLREYLITQHRTTRSDTETAARLSNATLSERISEEELAQLISESNPGPDSATQLRVLADYSAFSPPKLPEVSDSPQPSAETQKQILRDAKTYSQNVLQHLPDFLAMRQTYRFDDTAAPRFMKPSLKTPIRIHPAGEFESEITFRDGHEVTMASHAERAANHHFGMLSRGEFGPILAIVLSDVEHGSIGWARWEKDKEAGRVAVFQYQVPQAASHYFVDFCCYANPTRRSEEIPFRTHPTYHGEVVIDPSSGAIRRIMIQANLGDGAPVVSSGLVVEYGRVKIGGQFYTCPARSIATTSIIRNQGSEDSRIERSLNEIHFLDYHKFGSTSHIIPTD